MNLSYNGVFLTEYALNYWKRDAVLDPSGQDWLFDRHTIDGVFLVNPNRLSAKPGTIPIGGDSDFAYTPTPGVSPGITDMAIRERLMTPRRTLEVYSGTDLVFYSPKTLAIDGGATEATSDANNGPIVHDCSVIKALGNQTFLVHFVVETCTRDCPNSGVPPGALLSSRYSTTHDIDDRHFTTITHNGVSIFRTDILDLEKKYADAYRESLVPPCPRGFRRVACHFQTVPARNALSWTVTDREMPVYVGDAKTNPWNLVDFRATLTQAITKQNGVAAGMPTLTLQCQAVGNNQSSRWNLTKFCMRVAVAKCQIGRYPGLILNDLTISQSLHDKVVELNCSVTLPPQHKDSPKAASDGFPAIWTTFVQDDSANYLFEDGGATLDPPNRGGTAGTYPYLITANKAATYAACQKIGEPTKVPGYYYDQGAGTATDPKDPATPAPPGGATVKSSSISNPNSATAPASEVRSISGSVNGVSIRAEVVDDWPMPPTKVRERAHWYSEFKVFVHWITHGGRLAMPICGGAAMQPGQKRLSVIQTHTEWQEKVIEWEATRVGKEPERPNPRTIASMNTIQDETLLDSSVSNGSPVTGPDGHTTIYSSRGQARYAYQRSLRVEGIDTFPNALVPWLSAKFSDAYMTPGSFVRHITEDVPQPSGDDKLDKDFGNQYVDKKGNWKAISVDAQK